MWRPVAARREGPSDRVSRMPGTRCKEGDDGRDRPQQTPDPTGAVPGGGKPNARGLAARLGPDRAPDAAGGRAERAAGADRRRRVRQPGTFGGPIRRRTTPGWPRGACSYNRFHVTALCSPTRAALLTGRNSHAVGFGSVGEFAGGFPGYSANLPRDCAPAAAHPAGQRLQHRGVRQVAPDARRPAGPGRAVRPLAERLGIRLLLRLPRRRRQPVGHRAWPRTRRSSARRRSSTTRSTRTTSRTPWPTRPSSGSTACAPRTRTKPFFVYFSTGCSHAPHHVAQAVGRQVQGQVRPGLGQAPRGDLRPPEGARGHPGRRRADAARRGVPGVGRRARAT